MPYTGEEIGNPAVDIAELIWLVQQFSEKRMAEAPKPKLWDGTVQGAQVVITKVKAGECYEHGQLSAPIDAWMEIVMQSYPGEEEEELLKELDNFVRARYHDPKGLEIRREYRYCRPAATDPDEAGVQTLARCAGAYTDPSPRVRGHVLLRYVRPYGIGPHARDAFRPHRRAAACPDEWVDLQSMEICVRSLMDFIRAWCG